MHFLMLFPRLQYFLPYLSDIALMAILQRAFCEVSAFWHSGVYKVLVLYQMEFNL